jgi:hypothetical protein
VDVRLNNPATSVQMSSTPQTLYLLIIVLNMFLYSNISTRLVQAYKSSLRPSCPRTRHARCTVAASYHSRRSMLMYPPETGTSFPRHMYRCAESSLRDLSKRALCATRKDYRGCHAQASHDPRDCDFSLVTGGNSTAAFRWRGEKPSSEVAAVCASLYWLHL